MSRFANPEALAEVDLGPCECPGAPHDHDAVQIRAEYSAREIILLSREMEQMEKADADDAALSDALTKYVVSWNLIGNDGEPCPPDAASLALLKSSTLTTIVTAIGDAIKDNEQLPNPSGAPSAASSPESASPDPTATTPGT